MSKRPRLATAFRLTFAAFQRDNASRFGAALGFYIVFTLAPTLLIIIAAAGMLIGRQAAEREVVDRIAASFGSAAAVAIAAMVKDAPRQVGWFASSVGLVSLYFGVTGVYRQIDDAIVTIWGDKADEPGPIKRSMRVLLVLAVGLVVLLSVMADAAIAITGKYAAAKLIGGRWLWQAVQLSASTLILTGLFGAVFRYLPRSTVQWRDVRLGAAVTASLFVIGKFALAVYLGKAGVGSPFGAAGSIVVVLLWTYWSAQILFFGLEFTHVYSQDRPSP